MKKILVIQNDADEGLGVFADELEKMEIEWDTVHAYKGDPIPSDEALDELGYRGAMIFGGPMSATDDAHFPFLREETRFIQACLRRKLPMLNICLGAQLLARACNVRLTIGREKEIGWYPVYLVDWYAQRNPLFFQAPQEFVTFHWHQDTFDYPTEGYRLVRSDRYDQQAFCINGNAYGIQFHTEVTKEMVQLWVERELKKPNAIFDEAEAEKILAQADAYLQDLHKVAHQMIYGFETLLREPDYRRAGETLC